MTYPNIESKKFPGHQHYVGYGDGVWHIHKHPKGYRATHQGNGKGGTNHGTFVKSNLKEVSDLLASHAAKASSQHSEEQPKSYTDFLKSGGYPYDYRG